MTTTLPAPLRAWHPWLGWFAPELAAALGEMLQRLHPLLGRFQGRRQGGTPEPDGVEDLRRRGSYERLLSSEWLLATELPDEFLRRAASGEHLFLAPRPRARQADRLIVALFDAGPWQLGAPRLAHLALWILLARRAAEAGGELRWGTLQQPGRWHAADSPAALQKMLRARSFADAGPEQWRQWSDWLAAHAGGLGECWWIGHDAEAVRSQANAPTHSVRLRQSLSGEALEVGLRTATAARTMRLPLPPPRPAAQLLTGRFENEAPVHAHRQQAERVSLKHAPIISPSGALVAVRLLDGHGMMVFRTTAPKDGLPSKPKRQLWTAGAEPLAAMFAGKSLGAVLSVPTGDLSFWQMGAFGMQARPPREAFEAPPGRGSLLPCIWQRGGSQARLHMIDAAGRLVWWAAPHAAHQGAARGPMVLDRDVLCLAPVNEQRIVYAAVEKDMVWIRFAATAGRERGTLQLGAATESRPQVLLAGGIRWLHDFGGCAIRLSAAQPQESWRVVEWRAHDGHRREEWECRLAPGALGVGLVHLPHSTRHALVVQAANRRDFVLQSCDGAEPLYSAPDAVEHVTVCPSSGMVAMLTLARELHLHSTAERSSRLVVHGSGAEAPGDHEAP